MKAVGIDAGSQNTKIVVMEDGNIIASDNFPTGEDAEAVAKNALASLMYKLGGNSDEDAYIVSTGISGKIITFANQNKAITTCLARGANASFPSARMVVDLGSESSTVLKISGRGRVNDWVNHDKCAAGTGLFLQAMAKLLRVNIEEMSQISLEADSYADITATCAVFAESEVISHVHRDPPTPKKDIAAGIFMSVVGRLMALCKRVGIEKDVVATGGVAQNKGLMQMFSKELGFDVLVSENPQYTAATGAAILAKENIDKGLA